MTEDAILTAAQAAADRDDQLRQGYLRLYELARHGARRVHDWYFDAAENIDEIPPAGHIQPFDFCPHADCTLAREAPSDLYVRAFRHGAQHLHAQMLAIVQHADHDDANCVTAMENFLDDFTRGELLKTSPSPSAGSTATTDQW